MSLIFFVHPLCHDTSYTTAFCTIIVAYSKTKSIVTPPKNSKTSKVLGSGQWYGIYVSG